MQNWPAILSEQSILPFLHLILLSCVVLSEIPSYFALIYYLPQPSNYAVDKLLLLNCIEFYLLKSEEVLHQKSYGNSCSFHFLGDFNFLLLTGILTHLLKPMKGLFPNSLSKNAFYNSSLKRLTTETIVYLILLIPMNWTYLLLWENSFSQITTLFALVSNLLVHRMHFKAHIPSLHSMSKHTMIIYSVYLIYYPIILAQLNLTRKSSITFSIALSIPSLNQNTPKEVIFQFSMLLIFFYLINQKEANFRKKKIEKWKFCSTS